MKSILNHFAHHPITFRPQSIQDFFALRLAQKLDDVPAATHYANLSAVHSQAKLLAAYWRTVRASRRDLGRRFQGELARINGNVTNGRSVNLLSLRIERRTVAASVFQGDHLEYTDVRQLSSVRHKALGTAASFVNWLLDSFPIESVAVETTPAASGIQRRALAEVISYSLQERLLPAWQVPLVELLEAYGYPPLKSRHELRKVVTGIWPILAGTHARVFIQDAVALGLYVQIERRFLSNS
jgi:hypothetical protein